MHKLLKSYQKRLTNLTVSNRSLLLLRLSEEQDIDLNNLDFVNGKPSYSFIENLLAGKKEIPLCPLADSRNGKVNELSKKIKKIDRRENFIFEERGAKDLYVGWPFVNGKFSDGTPVRCPLLFFPVTLELQKEEWILKLREDISVGLNKSFLLAYSHYNGISLPDEFVEASFEDFDKDSQIFRTQLYSFIKESPLEINFNQELFVNKLQQFRGYKKADYEQRFGNGELKLFPEAVLGIFPQAGSYLFPDYDFLLKNNVFPDLEDFFVNRNSLPANANIKEEQTITPFAIDASQEKIVLDMKRGKSLVVQGPPGTGKSQLICNLITDYIARGKTVLLVCQKRVALDVVYQRLKSRNLNDFVSIVHDFKNDRKNIYDQINAQIEKLEDYKQKNNSLDAIYLERSFVHVCRRIEQIVEELEEFKSALFDEKECGISVKELYLTSDPSKKTIDVKQEFKFFKAAEIKRFTSLLKMILPYASKFEKQEYLWKDRVSFSKFSVLEKKKLLHTLDHIPFYQTDVSDSIREILGTSLDLEDFEWLLNREEYIRQVIHLLEDDVTYSNFLFMLNKNIDQNWFTICEKQTMECFKGSGLESSLSKEQLNDFIPVLEQARQARSGIIKWIKWNLFSKDKYFVKRVCVANQLPFNRDGFEELERRVDNRMNLEHNLTKLNESGWLENVPTEKNLEIISDWFHHQNAAIGARHTLKELRNLKDYLNIPFLSFQELKTKLNDIVKIISEIPSEKRRWLEYLTPRQVSKILSAFDYAIELSNIVQEDFELLVEYDRLKEKFSHSEKQVYEKLIRDIPDMSSEEVIDLFENSIRLEWIDSIETKYPVLRSVSSLKMEHMEKELQECVEEKQKLSLDILLMKVRAATYADLEYNRLDNRLTYRELKHQVTKKRKIWPIRKIFASHSEEVFKLVPCWLASPESVSSIFPMEAMFDLVIFDEASQCYAENGIPSMYRARQILVTGDSKQLNPSDVYMVRWEEEVDESPELNVDSLLDLGKMYLHEESLKSHYRSNSLELIEFSNKHFYKGKLHTLPDFNEIEKNEPSIKYIRVEGVWENYCNKEEAKEVIRITKEIQRKDPHKSIGIVTFNYRQQMLIQDMLEEANIRIANENLFVKNIENVQGDERDCIIFSIGYAPNNSGKLSMQFGSLNLSGGENRLNVAITRAKEKIYIVTSFLPGQMDTSSVKHEGPKLLKEYLHFAMEVSCGRFLAEVYSENKSPEWYLKNSIGKLSLPFRTTHELPFGDLVVKSANKITGLVETDDDIFFKAISSKESHAYFPLNLRSKNWRFKQVYSRQFWENKDQFKDRLIKIFGANA